MQILIQYSISAIFLKTLTNTKKYEIIIQNNTN
jgi:hypothetical protein